MAFVAYGKQTIATAGTPQQCVLPTEVSGLTKAYVDVLVVLAASTNAGNVYVGDSTLVKATGVGVGAILSPGQSFTIPGQNGTLHPLNLWFDTDTNNNVVYASGVTK